MRDLLVGERAGNVMQRADALGRAGDEQQGNGNWN